MEDMWKGIGLDFETLIQTPIFEEIWMHLLHFGFEKTLERLMVKNPNMDLSYLDDEDELMGEVDATEKVVVEEMRVEKVAEQDVGSEKAVKQSDGVYPEIQISVEVEGGQSVDFSSMIM